MSSIIRQTWRVARPCLAALAAVAAVGWAAYAFVGQPYRVQSPSMTDTYAVGTRVWVDKTAFGARLPMLVAGVELDYRRLPGFGALNRGDVVVFNFPAGDTVAARCPGTDFYGLQQVYGRDQVLSGLYGSVEYRPVSSREPYMKRIIGLPGEWVSVSGDTVRAGGHIVPEPAGARHNYIIQTDGRRISAEEWRYLGIGPDERQVATVRGSDTTAMKIMGLQIDSMGHPLPTYQIPLSAARLRELPKRFPWIIEALRLPMAEQARLYPQDQPWRKWSRNHYGPVWIPRKGATLRLTLRCLPLYARCIKNYDGNTLEVRGGVICINGKPARYYTFKQDYYWVMGDNRDQSLDSRYWGFVPESHIIGKVVCKL